MKYNCSTCAYLDNCVEEDHKICQEDNINYPDYSEQINNITVPMSQVPKEIKQQWVQDYYEQGTQSTPIDEFTEALLDWLDDPKSK